MNLSHFSIVTAPLPHICTMLLPQCSLQWNVFPEIICKVTALFCSNTNLRPSSEMIPTTNHPATERRSKIYDMILLNVLYINIMSCTHKHLIYKAQLIIATLIFLSSLFAVCNIHVASHFRLEPNILKSQTRLVIIIIIIITVMTTIFCLSCKPPNHEVIERGYSCYLFNH